MGINVNQLQNPFLPPPPPQSQGPGLGFQLWAQDPMNAMKVQPSMTSPSAPLQPNSPSAAANPPAQAQASNPLAPPSLNLSAGQVPNLTPPTAIPAPQTQQQDMANDPGQYSKKIMGTKVGALLSGIAATAAGAAGGMHGNPGAGLDYAMGVLKHDEAVPGENQQTYNSRWVAPQQAALKTQQGQAALANTQANTEHTQAETSALQNPQPKAEKPENIQQLYADAVSDAFSRNVDPNKDPKVLQLQDAISGTQKQPTTKEPNKDDRAIQIYAKPAAQRTPEENSYIKGYEQYINKNKTQPGVARMEVLMNGRTVQVVDPNNPQNVVYDTAGHARQTGAAAPGSIPFQAEKGVAKAFTSGRPAEELNAFNTAIQHADLLSKAATALGNGDTRAINSLSNHMKTAFGSSDVTNFNTIAKIYTGEVTKAINAGHVTDAELNSVGATIPDNASPAQIAGAMNAFKQLMASKVQMRQNQYNQGMQGKPNFGGNPLKPPTQSSGAADPMGLR